MNKTFSDLRLPAMKLDLTYYLSWNRRPTHCQYPVINFE